MQQGDYYACLPSDLSCKLVKVCPAIHLILKSQYADIM